MERRYHVTTFGCQMNEHDSERMKGMLDSLGYVEAEDREGADLILFNTCSIRESADNRFIAHLGEAKRLKSEDPARVVGVGGCWAQSVKEEVFRRFPFVDVAFGPGQVHRLAEFLTSDSLTAQGYFEFEDVTGHLPMKRAREFQAWVQISQGCNCVCSYCIVPSVRGREVSRDPGELIAEIGGLAADGVGEITLLGQNVNSFGRDLPKDSRIAFAELLAQVDAVPGVNRIRYTSPHPKDMREDVIRAHAELDSLCEHIHLPLQSGSTPMLKRMRRTYGRERYMDRVALIREHVPDCAITTDIIVGFPGETEADFEQTLEVVDDVGYDGAFTFIFSPRRGTEAAQFEDQLPHPVKRERMQRLVELVQRRARERAERFVGRTLEVLVEGPSRTDASRLRGRTRHNKTVNFDGTAAPGELVEVEISSATSTTLSGSERLLQPRRLRVLALFGPTAVGKTGVALSVADRLRERGEDPVAVNCDSIQVYRGLETLSGAANAGERSSLEHRLLSFVDPGEEYSAGRYAEAAHREVDALIAEGRRPIVVGGTGLYLRAALADLDLRPPVPGEIRDQVEREIAARGPEALHGELDPELARSVDPNDRKRIARFTELARAGIEAAPEAERLWTAELRHPTLLVGLTMERERLAERIGRRVDEMIAAGAAEEARAALEAGPSRTARAALGFEQLVSDIDGAPSAEAIASMKTAHRAYARRQITWMRKMEGVELIDRTDRDDADVAAEIIERLGPR